MYENRRANKIMVTGTRILPRIQMCTDGSYCCNDDALCCSKGEGKFVNARGNLISNPYTTASSQQTTESTAFQSQPTSATGAATAPVPAAPASTSGGLSAAAKGGIGALSGVLFLVVIVAGLLLWTARRKTHSLKAAPTYLQSTADPHDQPLSAQKREIGYGPAELRVVDRANTGGPRELE